MEPDPSSAFILVMKISRKLYPAEISVAVAPRQIVNLDGKVVVPWVPKQFVLVLVAGCSFTEFA